MRKGIFGGTFDPIHIGHIHIAYEALYKLKLKEIVFMPNGQPPHKQDKDVSYEAARYEMVEVAIKDEKRFSISNYEISKYELSYSYETLIYLNSLEPETKWYFIVGTDSLMNFNKWKNVREILSRSTLVVFSRTGYEKEAIEETKNFLEEKYNCEILLLEIPLLDISSTDIKEKIYLNQRYEYLLPRGVDEVINKYKLYGKKV